ncbi:MAG: hypothetical protein ACR2NA_09770, partial [Solirubrobacterales bacterium]
MLILLVGFVHSAPSQAADGTRAKLAGAKSDAARLSRTVGAQERRLEAAAQRAASADDREQRLASLVANGRERTAELRDQRRDTQRRLREARSRLKRAKKVLAERLVAIYKGGMHGGGDVGLEDESCNDSTSRDRPLAAFSPSLRHTSHR